MNRVSTSTAYSAVLANLMAARARQAHAQAQVSSGKLAADLKGFGQGAEALTASRTLQSRVDQTRAAHEDRQVMLETLVGGLSEVDLAEAATRLAQAQTAVQASAQVFASLRETSLLDLLR